MAPIFSKVPPRDSAQKIERMVNKARPLLDDMFSILKDFGSMGNMCKAEAETLLDSVRGKLDTVCIGCVRLLESLCCLDVNRFAKPEKPLTGSLPILFVLMLLVILYNAFVFGYMPAAGIAINSSTSLMFHAWIFLTLASFAQAVRTDPGTAPMDPRWTSKDAPPPEARERKRGSQEARWCRKSGAYKPDRAHYCRVLKKGVLRMDHYCPWLGNTVGFYNQKFFFLFLLYANAACGQLGISFIQFLVTYTLPALTTFCLVGAEGLTLLLSSVLVPFLLFHLHLMARNTTTIEFCERMRSAGEDSNEAADFLRYDMGIFQNISAVLGSNPLLWLLPVGGPSGDGITFPTNTCQEEAFDEEPKDLEKASSEAKDSEKAASEEDPEATHPVASSSEEGDEKVRPKGDNVEEDVEREASAEASDEASEVEGSVAASVGDEEGFLVWRTSAEFVEDLTIGCQFLGEKAEDCSRGSFLLLVSSCMPGRWGRKASWKQSLTSPLAKSARRGLRGRSPAVKIVRSRSGSHSGALSGSENEGESISSASSDGQGHFLSD